MRQVIDEDRQPDHSAAGGAPCSGAVALSWARHYRRQGQMFDAIANYRRVGAIKHVNNVCADCLAEAERALKQLRGGAR